MAAKKNLPAPARKINVEEIYHQLRANGLKLTPPRKAILKALADHHGPFSAEDLFRKHTKRTCDLATVYRTLTSLEAAEMVRRCEFGDGIARYELNPLNDEHHHHLICNECRRIEVVDLSQLEESIARFAKKSPFTGISHILEFFGTCPECQG